MCTICGKQSRRRKGRSKSRKKNAIIAALAIVVVGLVGYYEGFINIEKDVIELKVPESVTGFVDDMGVMLAEETSGIRERISEAEIPVPESLPVRTESGFDHLLVETHIYRFTNEERQERGLPTLNRMSAIDSIARDHSADMGTRGYFSHDTPEGLDPSARGNREGYTCRKDYGLHYTIGLAENIHLAYTYSSYMTLDAPSSYTWFDSEETLARDIVDGWMDSRGHRENILNTGYDRVGIGVHITPEEEVYSTQNFC